MQSTSPEENKVSNWLPAPDGPFSMVMRLYWPEIAALDGSWTQPALIRVQ